MAEVHRAQCGDWQSSHASTHVISQYLHVSPTQHSLNPWASLWRLGWLNLLPLMIKQTKSPAPRPTLGVRKVTRAEVPTLNHMVGFPLGLEAF